MNEQRNPQIGDVLRMAAPTTAFRSNVRFTIVDDRDIASARELIESGRWVLVERKEEK